MNKTVVTIVFLTLILGAIVGNILLAILAPDRVDQFNGAMVTILGVATAAVVTFYGLGQQGEKLKSIERNTNGTLSAMQMENTRLTNIIIEHGLDPREIPSIETRTMGQS